MRLLRILFLALLGVSLALTGVLCAGAHSPLRMTGGARFVVEAAVSLAIYGAVLLFGPRLVHFRRALSSGYLFGGISGVVQIVHMSLEVFGTHAGERSGVTLAFMAGSFALWGAAAARVRLAGGKAGEAVVAAIFSGMMTMIIAVAYGIALAGLGYPDASYVSTWPEFVRSGWDDPRSFAIANSLEAAASHFLVAPIAGATVGCLGVLVSLPFRKPAFRATDDRA